MNKWQSQFQIVGNKGIKRKNSFVYIIYKIYKIIVTRYVKSNNIRSSCNNKTLN